ncbi:sulfurtransferase [Rhizomonospora bruguierae]|uniref:sulfurtransferase n=1 Tax=Rhizomonospora bruguierae TaxID=1581705 RepID=UPI0020BD5189|nr:sulfurtransferase [Micromonospora sp. NBRC 107566]
MTRVAEAAVEETTVLDVRWRLGGPSARPEYAAGHLPGAVFLELNEELCGPPGEGGRHPLPEPGRLAEALRAAGVQGDRPVLVYDGGDLLAAARAWWTLRWAGHPEVRVLEGGYPAWVAAGMPVSTEEVRPERGDFTVRPGHLPVLDAEGAADLARTGVLVDVRTPERYRGEAEPIDPVAGHIPGAVNVPAGTPIPAYEGQRLGAYCGSGITAARAVLELHRAGRTDAALYVGSWSGWITDPGRPVATGATP